MLFVTLFSLILRKQTASRVFFCFVFLTGISFIVVILVYTDKSLYRTRVLILIIQEIYKAPTL